MINDCGTHRDSPLVLYIPSHILFPFSVLPSLLLFDFCPWLGVSSWVDVSETRKEDVPEAFCQAAWTILTSSSHQPVKKYAKNQQYSPCSRHDITERRGFYLFCTSCIFLFSPELRVSWHWCNSCCRAVSSTWLIKPQWSVLVQPQTLWEKKLPLSLARHLRSGHYSWEIRGYASTPLQRQQLPPALFILVNSQNPMLLMAPQQCWK